MIRKIYKQIEPITIVAEFTAAQDVLLDLVDPVGDETVLASVVMTELVELPGLYAKTFSVDDLDAIVIGTDPFIDKLLLYRARLDPIDPLVEDVVGSIYRGGYVDQWDRSRGFVTSFSGTDIPVRNISAGMIEHIEYTLPHEKILKLNFSYRAMSGDVASVTTEIVDAPA